ARRKDGAEFVGRTPIVRPRARNKHASGYHANAGAGPTDRSLSNDNDQAIPVKTVTRPEIATHQEQTVANAGVQFTVAIDDNDPIIAAAPHIPEHGRTVPTRTPQIRRYCNDALHDPFHSLWRT